MTYMWVIWDNCVMIYETLILFFLAGQFVSQSKQQKRLLTTSVYLVLFLLLHKAIAVVFFGKIWMSAIFSGITDFLLLGMIWPGKWRQRLFLVCFYYVLLISLDLFLIFVFPIMIFSPHLEKYQFLCMITSRSLLLFIVLFSIKLGNRKANIKNAKMLITLLPALICIAIMFSLCGYEVYEVMFNQRSEIIIAAILLTVLILLLAYIQYSNNEILLMQQLDTQKKLWLEQQKYSEAVQQAYHTLRHSRHNMHHFMDMIAALVTTKQYEKALQLCGSAGDLTAESYIYTGNDTIDAIIYSKKHSLRQADIELMIHGSLPQKLEYDPADICIVLSNALENALEAVAKLPAEQRKITMRFKFHGWLLIVVENPINLLPKKRNKRFLSEKPGDGHGIGIESIEAACRRQYGYLEIIVKENTFMLSAIMQQKIR